MGRSRNGVSFTRSIARLLHTPSQPNTGISVSPTSRNKANANRNTKIQTIARDCFFVMPFSFSMNSRESRSWPGFFVMPFVLSMNIPFLKFRGDLKPPQSLSPSHNFLRQIVQFITGIAPIYPAHFRNFPMPLGVHHFGLELPHCFFAVLPTLVRLVLGLFLHLRFDTLQGIHTTQALK